MNKSSHIKFLVIFSGISLLSLFNSCAYAQSDALNDIRAKFTSHQKNAVEEKLFIHTDRNFYVAGEIIWLKIYNIISELQLASGQSKVAYIELVDRNNVPVLQTKIALEPEGGSGSLQIPLTLSSDYYVLRAYTLGMRNGGSDQFFNRNLAIVNPLKGQAALQGKQPVSYNCTFFPEGGNLISGLPVKMGLEIQDNSGKGVNGKGVIVDQNHDTITTFSSHKFGMGSFDFTPQPNHTYRALITLENGSNFISPLPESLPSGYVMSLEEIENDRLKVTVRTNSPAGYPEVFMIAHSKRNITDWQRNVLSAGITTFYINKNKLENGITAFTIFNSEKQPVNERLFFKQPLEKRYINTASDKGHYKKRENVTLSVQPLDATSADPLNMSLSVYRLDSLQEIDEHNISSYLWLTSDLSGTIEHPSYYLNSSTAEVKQDLDNLMLVHGWRRFKWQSVLNSSQHLLKYPMERSGHLITTKVTDTRTNLPAGNIQVYLSIPDSKYKLYTAKSDTNGLAFFTVNDYYGASEIVLQTNTQRDSLYKVDLLSSFAAESSAQKLPDINFSAMPKKLLQQYSIGMQSQHIYVPDSIQHFILPELKDTFDFYGKPEYQYKLDDYTRFTTMEEVLREYVREINVGVKGRGALKLKLFNEDKRELFSDNILVVLDGVPLFNTDKLFSYDPLKFKKIDIISKNYVLGSAIFNALASFITYQENYEGLELDSKAVAIDYEGLQLQREFYSPSYASEHLKGSRVPDFRNTLYWSSNLQPGNTRFYTGDLQGRYVAVFQGITADGKPFVSSNIFEVQ
jgi:hypothetical protein